MGAALLVAATLPQAAKLLRTRSARDFSWGFIALNFVGITLLALRSAELRETGFLVANLSTASFWLLAFAVKAWETANPSMDTPTFAGAPE